MSTFATTIRPTSFGFFDSEVTFQNDADKVVTFVLRKLGEDVLSVELTKKMMWTSFEEATLMFNAQIIEYQAKSNLTLLLGNPTGSIDPTTGKYSTQLNLTNTYLQPNLEWLVRQAEPYASEIGYGQSMDSYSGSIILSSGKQDYNLYTELVDAANVPLLNYMVSGSTGLIGRMKVLEVYHYAPVQYVFNSNLASNFIASGLPVESYIPDTRFYVLPLFEDVLRANMLKTAQKLRRSHYSYRISGRMLRIYPTPSNIVPSFSDKLWIRVAFPPSAAPGLIGTFFSGSQPSGSLAGGGSFAGGQEFAQTNTIIFGANSPANIPMGFISYASLNPWARNWIFQMTIALCKEMLGMVRGKIKGALPIPGAELSLNGEDLVTQGREDKKDLLYGEGGLMQKLESLTYDKLDETLAARAENQAKMMKYLPVPPKYAIFIG
jgi:hypothetical protein